MPMSRAVLSLAPNTEIAKFFTGGGARSIAACPTTTAGEPCRTVSPETSWPTPRATAAVSTPAIAPNSTSCRGRPGRRDHPGRAGR